MSKITMRFGKTLLIAAATVLVLAALTAGGVLALGASDPASPPTGSLPDLRLEVAWARLQAAHAAMQAMFDFAAQRTNDVQRLIDQARASGQDVAAVQAALTTLESATHQAQPVFDSSTATINAHPGFDDKGSVTEAATAAQTVNQVAQDDKQIRSIVSPAQQAFLQAFQAFRQSGGMGGNNGQAADLRLELAWARLQAAHARLEVIFDFADQRTAQVQQLIDRASSNGRDVSAVQNALNGLEAAIKQARPIFEGTTGNLASHQGFDANGNVTDAKTAFQTVKDLASKDQQIGAILKPAEQALKQAIDALRQTTQPTPTPSS